MIEYDVGELTLDGLRGDDATVADLAQLTSEELDVPPAEPITVAGHDGLLLRGDEFTQTAIFWSDAGWVYVLSAYLDDDGGLTVDDLVDVAGSLRPVSSQEWLAAVGDALECGRELIDDSSPTTATDSDCEA